MKKIRLKKEIYSRQNLNEAIKAYGNIARILILPNKDEYVMQFFDCKYGEDRTIKEFENYLIGLENS